VSTDERAWPGKRGYRMPAEWALHEATWLSWPHNHDTWPGHFERVEPAMVEVVRAIAETENVHINVRDAEHAAHVAGLVRGVADPERLRLHFVPTNDAWIRDHGAIFVVDEDATEPRLALDFDYNAWGGKYPPYDLDQRVARRMAEILEVPHFVPGIVLEGGSIEVNGGGVLLTTEQCLLNPNRNPALGRAEIERLLEDTLGVAEIVWLGDGIEGDDTDGHIDDLTRFVAADRVVTVVEADPRDANYAPLKDNLERLRAIRLDDGRPLSIVELPMPDPQVGPDGRLPASYANFYVGNEVVLLPTFACRQDAEAIATLQRCYPTRRVVPIDCRAVVVGLGTLHCLTQQIPVPQR
jgi:agmatine deiminase